MRRQLLGGTLSVCLFAATAGAATLHPAVEAQLSTGSGDEPISVIAYLEEAPIATLDAQLQAERATRLQRHTTIVNALQAQQQTQAPFKAWLDQAMLDGKVLGYTSYWITNAIVIQATKETIREIERRADVEQIELNWQAELIEPVSQPNQDHGWELPASSASTSFLREFARSTRIGSGTSSGSTARARSSPGSTPASTAIILRSHLAGAASPVRRPRRGWTCWAPPSSLPTATGTERTRWEP